MRYILIILTLVFWSVSYGQNTQTPEQIRQEMATIRRTTNWNNPEEAKKANEKIKELAKKLMASNSGNSAGGGQQQQQGSNSNSKDGQKLNEMNQEMMDQKMDLWSQIWKSAAGGKGADILLAEPLREEIVQEFKVEETIKSQDYYQTNDFLVLNLSMPGIDLVIDAMSNFMGIKMLVIYSEKPTTQVDLTKIFQNAKTYPLTSLYIFNFGGGVSKIPEQIGQFTQLESLSIFNNNLTTLPTSLSKLKKLKELYVDMNPLTTIFPVANSLTALDTLGIAKTKIPNSEIQQFLKLRPNCKILTNEL